MKIHALPTPIAFYCLAAINVAMAYTTMQDFFPEAFAHGNLSEVTWDHAVNSKELLQAALANNKHMIEADVLLGWLVNATPSTAEMPRDPKARTVIMAHPPLVASDLSLEHFLKAVATHNANPNKHNKKGIKLDFKGSDAYARSMSADILLNVEETAFRAEYAAFPIWINGDIAKGPNGDGSAAVDCQLARIRSMPGVMRAATWSLGWTTGDYQEGIAYTRGQIDAMLEAVRGISNVTFPVRAMYAAKSRGEMESLLRVGTLTIWSGRQDDAHVDVVQLAKLIADNLDKVYVDVPDALWRRIQDARPQPPRPPSKIESEKL